MTSFTLTLERLGLKALHRLDPERAHHLAICALKYGFAPKTKPYTSTRLHSSLAGLPLENPIGLAAGFDKNATVLHPLSNTGFGFLEVGAITPKPQPGNPKPRLFRLREDEAAINRFGFNNDGMESAALRLAQRPKGVIGLNLGANKTSENRADDFARVLSHCGTYLDFATINVSSPNTEKLRDLQGKAALTALTKGVMTANQNLEKPLPIFLKIAPDLTEQDLQEIAEVVTQSGISGVIATNTTLSRDGLHSVHKSEMGGLSGAPLFEPSTRILAQLSQWVSCPIIGVGGVSTAQQAYTKIKAGASAVQLYTSLIYNGLSSVPQIAEGLDALLEQDGYNSVCDAIGTERGLWL